MHTRVKLPDTLSRLLRSEMKIAIEEANLGDDDTEIAKSYLLKQIPHVDIAAEMGCDRSTISKRMPQILQKVEYAAKRLEDK